MYVFLLLVYLILRPRQRPKETRGELFLPYVTKNRFAGATHKHLFDVNIFM